MIVGIDLGTTNSAVAIWRDGRAQLIPNGLGHVLTPSAVSIDEDDHVLVGLAARERQVSHPERTATAFKRYMGSNRVTLLGGRSFLPEELSALVLRSLCEDASRFLGEDVREAVITVPAYFNEKQRRATRRAGELAGLKVERLLNEPTAAALAYGIHELGNETRFLVFDLGGGTFDVSVLEIFDGVIEVRSSTGDNRLGGEDFNDLLIDEMFARFGQEWSLRGKHDDVHLHERMRVEAERARRQLSTADTATMNVAWRERQYSHSIDSGKFEQLAEKLLARLRDPVLRALRDSDIRANALEEIVLVGGATRMPIVRRVVTRMFGRFPSTQLNPDEVVALGAAVQAGLKARDAALKEIVMTDVCPYTLGVGAAEHRPDGSLQQDVFAPIIERNTVIPASRTRPFRTVQDRQRSVRFDVYQGEARSVTGNIHLGGIEIPVPAKRAGEVQVNCRFSYDINGLLEIDVEVPDSGARRQLVIIDEQSAISAAELAERRAQLEKLKVHPRDTQANRAALARAERCYEEFLGERREAVAAILREFESALDRQDPRAADAARELAMAALDRLEGETYL